MAHSCRWRFPARPGGSSNSGAGRKAGRIRVTASLRSGSGTDRNAVGLGPGYDAALQVSDAIGTNLQKFLDVLGESSRGSSISSSSGSGGEEDTFGGFVTVTENGRLQSPGWTPTAAPSQEKKPRGRPPRGSTPQKTSTGAEPQSVRTTPPIEKVKRLPGRPPGSGEKRRGRPPASASQLSPSDCRDAGLEQGSILSLRKDVVEDDREKKVTKRTPLGSVQQQQQQQESEAKFPKMGRDSKVTKLKRLQDVKLNSLKSKTLKCIPVPVVPRRKRGRPPSAERRKAENAAAALELPTTEGGTAKQKAFRDRLERDLDTQTTQHLRAYHPANDRTSPNAQGAPSKADPSTPSKLARPLGLRQSPRHMKLSIGPPSKRTDATIAKQLLQRAKKGAQKKKLLEKEAMQNQGADGMDAGIRRNRRTQLKNIRQFIMPVVSTVSLRIIKTPKRFIEDVANFGAPPPQTKMARLESSVVSVPVSTSPAMVPAVPSTSGPGAVPVAVDSFPPPPPPNVPTAGATVVAGGLLGNNGCGNSNGRFSSSAASCGSSAVSQHSSQLSSGESSRSSSPSLDDSSCDSQISDGTQELSEEPDRSPSSHGEREAGLRSPRPLSPSSEPETEPNRRGRRGQGFRRGGLASRGRSGLMSERKRAIVSPATGVLISSSQAGSRQASSTASSSSSPPPPPLLSPPQPPQSASSNVPAIGDHPHSPWIMPHPIASFLPSSPVLPGAHDKRRAILREPTFRWTSSPRGEQQCFSSAKYAKEGLIRKPIFDNFRPPPLTPQDVGLIPPGPGGGGVAPGTFPATGGAGTRLFSPLHHHHHHHHHQHQHQQSRFEPPHPKRSPLLRAPRFTPSAAHSRIFESVTFPSSSGSSHGSQSPLQATSPSNRALPRRKRRTFGLSRGQPRSPSHSMTTRSSQSGVQTGKSSSELSVVSSSVPSSVTGNSSPLPGVAVSPIAPSALNQASYKTLSSSPLGSVSHGASDGRRVDGCLGGGGGSSVSSSSQLFPRFASSPPASSVSGAKVARERSHALRDALPKEKERDGERNKEKESKREAKKDWEKSAKMDGKDAEEPSTQKKAPGSKKPLDSGAEAASTETCPVQPLSSKGRLSKKGRVTEKVDVEATENVKDKERGASATAQPRHSAKAPSTPTLHSVLVHAEKQPATDRHVAGLIEKAKAQLYKIQKSKSLKAADQPKVQGQESDSSETSVRGPRIKHVCRRAAVALGNRATFPDDMPTLSALPWEEREKILSSMGNDDKSSVAGSEEAEPSSPPIKPVTRHKTVQEATPRKGRRSRRCGQCPGCQVPEDCGECANCLDKPKFGGRNIKKQCCKKRKCQNLQWMPSKMFLQKQAKGKKDKKKNRLSEKKDGHHSVKSHGSEVSLKPASASSKDDAPLKKSESPPPPEEEDKQQQPPPLPASASSPEMSSPPPTNPEDPRQPQVSPSSACRKERKQQQMPSSLSFSPPPATPSTAQPPVSSQGLVQVGEKKEGSIKSPSVEPKKKPHQHSQHSSGACPAQEAKQIKKPAGRSAPSPKPKPKEKEKEKQMVTKPDRSNLNFRSTPSSGAAARQKAPRDGVHRIRVDFKEDRDIEKVWEMGGLSILTSVPIAPRVVCFLCASSGNVEFVFCQVCCEPFHLFCLGEMERPVNEERENWCCRRCRFCHVCGRQHQKTKLLECNKCRNSFHPECLGPNHPTRPTKRRTWICPKCVHCKSCGATEPGKSWNAQWSHDFSLCHDCAKRFSKGHSCPVCDKCHDDDESSKMKCGTCDRWVHVRCEGLSDEMYDLLCSLPEPLTFVCISCADRRPPKWRLALEKKLQSSMSQVLSSLLNSRTSSHLLRYRQAVMKPPELNPETEESLPSRRSPEGPDPPVLTEAPLASDWPLDLESVEKKMASGLYTSVPEFSDDVVRIIQTAINLEGGQAESRRANSMVKTFFVRQMERAFPWFKVKESKLWDKHRVAYNGGLLPNAVLPPSLDHNYAQWQERNEMACAEHPLLMKIIPAPSSKAPGEADSSVAPPPTRPELTQDLVQDDTPDTGPATEGGDSRRCVLCLNYGDENTDQCGRLLYVGQDEWAHVNCALWSAEVFEDDDGSLKNVHAAVRRGRRLRCENCQRPGATVGCCLASCSTTYHFMCARQCRCVFLEDKKVYCPRHRDAIKGEALSDAGFEVTRRILVDLEGIGLKRTFVHGLEPENVHLMIGSMTIDCLGVLTELSDCERKLFPVGYQCSRVYWSTLDARKRCVYTCRILACRPLMTDTGSNSTAPQENNLTIAHSPPPYPVDRLDLVHADQAMKPKSRVCFRSRHPSYPPCHRSSSCRSLPSPDAVCDPPPNSRPPAIGSRRHSTSSPVSQPHIQRSFCPQESNLRGQEHNDCDLLREKVASDERPLYHRAAGAQCRPGSSVPDVAKKSMEGGSLKSAATGTSQASPLLGTAVMTGHQRGNGGIRTEKGKQATKDTDLPAGVTLVPCRPPTPVLKDKAIPGKEGSNETGSTKAMYLKGGGGKNSHDCLSGPSVVASLKPVWSSGVKTEECDKKRGSQTSSPVASSHGNKLPKVKVTAGREPSEERKDSKVPLLNSKGGNASRNSTNRCPTVSTKAPCPVEMIKSDSQSRERQFKSRERGSGEKKHRSAAEPVASLELRLHPPHGHPKSGEERLPGEKRCPDGVSLTPPKTDPNGTRAVGTCSDANTSTAVSPGSLGPLRKLSRAVPFSRFASSESSESDGHLHPEECEEPLVDPRCPEDDGTGGEDHRLEGESPVDKHHEDDSDGSAKRRYPRRSARARSNMFFGLTPFYGVRSYGEEDIPFSAGGDTPSRKRSGSGKQSAEGQVDGADDMSSSTSADSGEDEEGGFGFGKDSFYYNFTRTIINPASRLPTIEGKVSHIHRFLRDGANETAAERDQTTTASQSLELRHIGQLDGVDDDCESDAGVNTSSTTATATTSSTLKSSSKKKARDSRAEKSNADAEKEASGGGSAQSRDGRKNQKDNCLQLAGVKSQGQDPLESQLSLSTDLLKSDSDNNNSDDCNILPSDIMEFVLNTPSMQSLGQQEEAASAEPFSLDEGYGVDVNRRKDILFEDFASPPLASTEPVESGVNASITVEEPYGLPMELPSDLSVLTTRSPSVNNQSHGSEREMLSVAMEESGVDKGGDEQRSGNSASRDSPRDSSGDSQAAEGDMTPERFITSRMDGDHISSPGISQAAEAGSQDLSRTSATPGLPSSPTLATQGPKFIPAATVSSVPSQITSASVQATTSHMKPGPEKLIVLNQHLQPLYVLQTLPNGVTQKIQIAPTMSPTGVMSASSLTGISAGISASQPIFPAATKGLVPVPHHAQLHAFASTNQTSFQSVIPSTTSGLFIGVPSHDPQIVASEAGRRHDLATSVVPVTSVSSISSVPAVLAAGHGKKRPILRLQPRKNKKPPRPRSQPTLAPSDVGQNMTLINLSAPQITAGIPAQPGLVDLSAITATAATSHRKMPNIIKRSKSGVMYIDPALLPHPMPISTAPQSGILGHDTSAHLLPCTMPGLNPNQSVLNVVSVPHTAPGNLLGANSVSLSTPGPISNLVFKASPHNLGLSDQQMVLQSRTPIMSQISSPLPTSITSSICVLPPNQISMSASQQRDKDFQAHPSPRAKGRMDKTTEPPTNASGQLAPASGSTIQDLNRGDGVRAPTQGPQTSQASGQQQALTPPAGKRKQKAKRPLPSVANPIGKKHKRGQTEAAPRLMECSGSTPPSSKPGNAAHVVPEQMGTGTPDTRGTMKSDSVTRSCESSSLKQQGVDARDEKPKASDLPGPNSGIRTNAVLSATPDQKDNGSNPSSVNQPKKGLLFEICSDDGFKICCESMEEAWKSLTDKVQEARSHAKLKELSFDGVNGLRMLGVVHDAVVFLLEQLSGAKYCKNYRYRFHKPEEADEPPVNPHGSARAEVYQRRSVLDMFNFLASKHRRPPEYHPHEEDEDELQVKSARRAAGVDVSLPVRFGDLKRTSRESVGVYRSAIHGRGLFCRRNIDAGEMVIEYSGNVIRSVLTDKRERYYDGKGIGCYMFRIDDYEVVDATTHGNAARFINHSCEPNCYSRVVSVDGQKHIVIFATRKIYRGEELTYDYKFPIEEPGNKLPCNCGAKKCRKFLN